MSKAEDNKALLDWEKYIKTLRRSTVIDLNETKEEQLARIAKLEWNPERWFKYYFPNYCYAEPANFHKRATKRIIANPEWYEVRAWSRELAKSSRTMMEDFYLALADKSLKSLLMVSNNHDDATRLLKPYKLNFENNQRIINDYGVQQSHGEWKDDFFITKSGVSFLGVGAGESPRGLKNEEYRPDKVNLDDFDTDKDCRNPDMVDNKWAWFEKAVYGTRSISRNFRVVVNGNIIAEYCCIKKAMEMADHVEVINIRDDKGNSTWPEKNTNENIDRVLSKISYASQQGEYFNNPITQGKVFDKLHYKKMQPIRDYKLLVSYTDPSYKAGKKNDYKAKCLIGKWRDEYHVIDMKCAQTTTATMLDWHYEDLKKYNGIIPIYFIIEWPSIDEIIMLELEKGNQRHGITLPLRADERVKPDKFYRIESLLEPLNRNEKLWFNEKLQTSQHMKNTEAQFLALSPTSRAHDDAPDAVEGGVFDLNSRTINDMGKVQGLRHRVRNPKRF